MHNIYQGIQPKIMQILTEAGGEMKFEDVYHKLRELYPKISRVQVAANALQLHWYDKVIWDSPVKPEFEIWLRSHENLG